MRILVHPGPQKMGSLQGSAPLLFQFLERPDKRFTLGKNQQTLSRNTVLIKLPYDLAENPLHFISSNCVAEPLADNDPDTARLIVHLVHKQIEYIGGKSPPVALHLFNVPTGPQKYALRIWLRHNQIGRWEWQANAHHSVSNTLHTIQACGKLDPSEPLRRERGTAIRSIGRAP